MLEGVEGQPLELTLVLADEDTGKFPQAEVYNDAGGLVTTIDLPHVATGMYNAPWLNPTTGQFNILFLTYNEIGHTTRSIHEPGLEQMRILSAAVATLSASIPVLERPATSSFTYKLLAKFRNAEGVFDDPDSNIVNVAARNQAGTSRNANLSALTMTRTAAGQYEVDYVVADTHLIEELIFTFSLTENSTAISKEVATTVLDTSEATPTLVGSGLNPNRS